MFNQINSKNSPCKMNFIFMLAVLCLLATHTAQGGYKRNRAQRLADLLTPQPTQPPEPKTPGQELDMLIEEVFQGVGSSTDVKRIHWSLKRMSELFAQEVVDLDSSPVYREINQKVRTLRTHCESAVEQCSVADLNRINELTAVEDESVTLSIYVLDCKRRILANCVDQVIEEAEAQIENLDEYSGEILDNLASLMSTRRRNGVIEKKTTDNMPLDRYFYIVANMMEDLSGEAVQAAAQSWIGGRSAYEQEFNRIIRNSCRTITATLSPNLCYYDPDLIRKEASLLIKATPLTEWCAGGKHCSVIQKYKDDIIDGSFEVIKSRTPWFGKAD